VDDFGKVAGLGDEDVTVLDPAAGTGTFLTGAIRVALAAYTNAYGSGMKESFLRRHILQHFYGFEILVAPYIISYISINFLLSGLGIGLRSDERLQFYLTNALQMEETEQMEIPGLASLSKENQQANKIKKDNVISVILGNPPYHGSSTNSNKWTERLLKENLDGTQSYYYLNGECLSEQNKKWLQDDYVKFLQFAQWKIEKAGYGVVGMITNHNYLDNRTFRGMRQSLLKTFDKIYILNLHGSIQKSDRIPKDIKDESVFKIQVGVAIVIFIKYQRNSKDQGKEENCDVYYSEFYGSREQKYEWLGANNLRTTRWEHLSPISPFYFFTSQQEESNGYWKWVKITDIFKIESTGIVTAKDGLCIDFKKDTLVEKIKPLRNPKLSEEYLRGYLSDILRRKASEVESYGWSISRARQYLQVINRLDKWAVPISYRPLDNRFIFYHKALVCGMRNEVMKDLLGGGNLALITTRHILIVCILRKTISIQSKINEVYLNIENEALEL